MFVAQMKDLYTTALPDFNDKYFSSTPRTNCIKWFVHKCDHQKAISRQGCCSIIYLASLKLWSHGDMITDIAHNFLSTRAIAAVFVPLFPEEGRMWKVVNVLVYMIFCLRCGRCWHRVSLCRQRRIPAPDLVPATAPSFFPKGSSSSTPHHSPLAKSVSPT